MRVLPSELGCAFTTHPRSPGSWGLRWGDGVSRGARWVAILSIEFQHPHARTHADAEVHQRSPVRALLAPWGGGRPLGLTPGGPAPPEGRPGQGTNNPRAPCPAAGAGRGPGRARQFAPRDRKGGSETVAAAVTGREEGAGPARGSAERPPAGRPCGVRHPARGQPRSDTHQPSGRGSSATTTEASLAPSAGLTPWRVLTRWKIRRSWTPPRHLTGRTGGSSRRRSRARSTPAPRSPAPATVVPAAPPRRPAEPPGSIGAEGLDHHEGDPAAACGRRNHTTGNRLRYPPR